MSMTATPTSIPSHGTVRRLLERVKHNDRAGPAARSALPFVVGNSDSDNNKPVGLVLPRAAEEFKRFPSVFSVTDHEVRLLDKDEWWSSVDEEEDDAPGTKPVVDVVSQRSEALRGVMEALRDEDAVPALSGWRDEAFAVRGSFGSPPEVLVERAAAVLLGVPSYGVFVNGYTCEGGGGQDESSDGNRRPTHVWIGTRSPDKPTWPCRWDSLAAGGLGAGAFPREAAVEECAEEAGIDRAYCLRHLSAASAVSYTGFNEDGWGLKRDVLFCFDLEVPPSFVPVPVDGEVESFRKIPIQPTLFELLAEPIRCDDDSDNRWKPNVGVVLIDFLVRHGFVDADDPSFLELVGSLRGAPCS